MARVDTGQTMKDIQTPMGAFVEDNKFHRHLCSDQRHAHCHSLKLRLHAASQL
jgi:hypothetical protein